VHFDFATFLVVFAVVTGLIWLGDTLLLAKKRRLRATDGESVPVVVDYARSFFPVIVIVLIIRSFLFEPFRIPSSSMMPTLLIGDFILVNKFAYGLRLPVTNQRIISLGEPERGDVFVFRYPHDPSVDYIKRVVGLPGDTITYRDKTIFVNGKAVAKTDDGRYTGVGQGKPMSGAELFDEHLGNTDHSILVTGRRSYPHEEGSWVVPPHHYFAMGDNRDRSADSRFWGFVPEENLVGRAEYVWMNWDLARSGIIDWSRIGDRIR